MFTDTSSTKRTELDLILKDGRKLAYAEYGQSNGYPVFAFHGTPGSRIWFAEDDTISKEEGIRLITVDRPGFGLSDLQPGRGILDFPQDIKELADHLNLSHFSVMGISGGATFALACAYALPERVTKCAMVSAAYEFENEKAPKEMNAANRWVFYLARHFPWLLRFSFIQQKKLIEKNPEAYIKSVKSNVSHLCKADQKIMQKEGSAEELLLHMKEAFRLGVKGAVQEAALMTKPWGFAPEDISMSIDIWHGAADTMAPLALTQKLFDRLPQARPHILENQGHFLTEEEKTWREILEKLLA